MCGLVSEVSLSFLSFFRLSLLPSFLPSGLTVYLLGKYFSCRNIHSVDFVGDLFILFVGTSLWQLCFCKWVDRSVAFNRLNIWADVPRSILFYSQTPDCVCLSSFVMFSVAMTDICFLFCGRFIKVNSISLKTVDSKSSLFYNIHLYERTCLQKCTYWKQWLEHDINIIDSHSGLIILSELSLNTL